jgi:alkylation response protein AidB-like acyl-CoA dehydrogenase
MDFELSDEQRMLTDSLRRYLDSDYDFEHRRRIARKADGFHRESWRMLAEMGVLGLAVPEQHGGFGAGAASQMVVHHELGRALVLEPVVPSAVMATAILQRRGTQQQQRQWLPAMAAGERIVSLAYLEGGARRAGEEIATRAVRTGQGWVLSGRKTLAWHAGAADALLVLAQVPEAGATVFLVPTDTAGVQRRSYPTIDGAQAADVELCGVCLPPEAMVGEAGEGVALLEHGLDHGIAALCAQAGGAMERLIEITAEYLRTRMQFGKALGSFQALQHRMADMLVQKELAVSMAYVAAQALDEPQADQRRRMLAGAKFMMAKAARFVGQQAVQLHGGMGMTDELAVGDYFKRLTMMDPMLGDGDEQLGRYCEVLQA